MGALVVLIIRAMEIFCSTKLIKLESNVVIPRIYTLDILCRVATLNIYALYQNKVCVL